MLNSNHNGLKFFISQTIGQHSFLLGYLFKSVKILQQQHQGIFTI